MQKKISISQIKDAAQEAFDLYKTNTDGKNADYIPYLANIVRDQYMPAQWTDHSIRRHGI